MILIISLTHVYVAMKPFNTVSSPRLIEIVMIITVSIKRGRSVYKLLVVSLNTDDNILTNLMVVK